MYKLPHLEGFEQSEVEALTSSTSYTTPNDLKITLNDLKTTPNDIKHAPNDMKAALYNFQGDTN